MQLLHVGVAVVLMHASLYPRSVIGGHLPEWLRRPWASGEGFEWVKGHVEELRLRTVCRSARCPNLGECWARGTATFMLLGGICTRHCQFCSIKTGEPEPLDDGEPRRVAEAVLRLGLRHVVLTSVTRDDLADGGASHFARTIAAIQEKAPHVTVEVLVPDFAGQQSGIGVVLEARPDVFGHNIETVRRLYGAIRSPRASYDVSLAVLRTAARWEPRPMVKSGLMVGHGETASEVRETLHELRRAGCNAVTIGQYLRPCENGRAVAMFVPPEEFAFYERMAYDLGFEWAMAGPFVRSSYRAEKMMETLAGKCTDVASR